MKGMHWWCYIGFEDLFQAVYHRSVTTEEGEKFKRMTRTERNNWVLDHIGRTNGIFVAMDQRADNGYIAFTVLPYLCKGLADGEIEVPEGKTEFVIPYSGRYKYGFTVHRTGNKYRVVCSWENGGDDHGETTISMDENGDLHDFRVVSPKLECPREYNFQTKHWEDSN